MPPKKDQASKPQRAKAAPKQTKAAKSKSSSYGAKDITVLEGLEAVLDLPLIVDRPNLLYGPWAEVPTTTAGVLLAKVHVAAHPLLAIAALTLTVLGNVRGALIALAAISVVTWLSFLPVALQDGLPFQSDVEGCGEQSGDVE